MRPPFLRQTTVCGPFLAAVLALPAACADEPPLPCASLPLADCISASPRCLWTDVGTGDRCYQDCETAPCPATETCQSTTVLQNDGQPVDVQLCLP